MEVKNIPSGLRSPGLLGRKPIIGLIMFVIGSLVFLALALNLVKQGPLIKWDVALANSFHALALNSPVYVIKIMIAGYYIGKEGITIIAIFLALYVLYKKFWFELVMVAASFGLSGFIFLSLSNIFNRPRPFLLYPTKIWANSPNIPGFPSGHTLSIAILCGLFIYFLLPKVNSYLGKAAVVLLVLLVAIYIGFSRLYVGDHYLTDIIAGYAVGIAWFGLSYTLVELVSQKYKKTGAIQSGAFPLEHKSVEDSLLP